MAFWQNSMAELLLERLFPSYRTGATTGTVVSIVPNKQGITVLDEYEIAFDDSRQLRLYRFQLTHVGLTNNKERG
jgi:hypothetical protein